MKIKDIKLAEIACAEPATLPDEGELFCLTTEELSETLLQVMAHMDVAGSFIDVKNVIFAILNTLIQAGVDIYKHSIRVQKIADRFAEHLGLMAKEKELLSRAAVLHDIGMLGIGKEIRLKPAPLTAIEQRLISLHPLLGEKILRPLDFSPDIIVPVVHHHEREDGKGYPHGIAGAAIPLASKIIALADAYDAMTVERPYREELSAQYAVEELERNAGTQFDRQLTDKFAKYVLNNVRTRE